MQWILRRFGWGRGRRRGVRLAPAGVRDPLRGQADPAVCAPPPLPVVPCPSAPPSAWIASHRRHGGPADLLLAAVPAARPAELGATRLVARGGAKRRAVVAVLVGSEGRFDGELYAVRDGHNRIGRLAGAEIPLDGRDDAISREHALIIHRDGAFGIKPLRAENPTWVNGEVVASGVALASGDRIRIGESSFRFHVLSPQSDADVACR